MFIYIKINEPNSAPVMSAVFFLDIQLTRKDTDAMIQLQDDFIPPWMLPSLNMSISSLPHLPSLLVRRSS
jgi:hypothetical protein